ncbi:hypothetical protein BABINDRAFT_158934 [Babjeviella inositovora NRRL Y-12698]|uniref:Protein CASP n=1 Tax=Babjeviella inositovora NRRL Y-12698 TaxID=984486 RepID=A0A1E3QXP2_9ASCO|nr:uncharacterized protein BABINDRAFT_158934 [Babjeviella inositovora NRRL Y-12698]ODQ82314.1 hypothetical protein BABINDRAFT_158934 [Babjeviella inositovora NRRL Y-12698]
MSDTHPFARALQSWAEIDLPTLQKELDGQGLEIKESQQDSLTSRKELATKTKEFRKLADSEKLAEVKLLLKLYQNEIDALTKKGKLVEGYFFGVYRHISEAPDPKPLLEASLDAVYDSTEVDRVKAELAQCQLQLTKYADYDQLQKKVLRTEQKAAENVATKVRAKEAEMTALMSEREANWQEKQAELTRQVLDARKQIEDLRTANEVTELRLKGVDGLKSSSATAVELEMVTRDYASAQSRVLELEKRNEELRREVTKKEAAVSQEVASHADAQFTALNELQSENAMLVARLEYQRRTLDSAQQEHKTKAEGLAREVTGMAAEMSRLKTRLESTKDYDEIRSELQALKTISFGDEEANNGGDETLDGILAARNKKLTGELAQFRAQHESLVARGQELETQLQTASEETIRLRALIVKLEGDLMEVQDKKFDTMSMVSGSGRTIALLTRSTLPEIAESPGQESAMLPIITKQRDRFRMRNKELEDESKKQFLVINELKRDINGLKRDNAQLYERTRYLSSFDNTSSNGTSKRVFSTATSSEAESQYSQSYEERLNPIEQFRVRERERINSRLSPIERVFISFSRAILSSKKTRMLFFAYCVGLHCMVMSMMVYVVSLGSVVPEVGIRGSTGGTGFSGAVAPDY